MTNYCLIYDGHLAGYVVAVQSGLIPEEFITYEQPTVSVADLWQSKDETLEATRRINKKTISYKRKTLHFQRTYHFYCQNDLTDVSQEELQIIYKELDLFYNSLSNELKQRKVFHV